MGELFATVAKYINMPSNVKKNAEFIQNAKNLSNYGVYTKQNFPCQTTSKNAKFLKFGIKNAKLATLASSEWKRYGGSIDYYNMDWKLIVTYSDTTRFNACSRFGKFYSKKDAGY